MKKVIVIGGGIAGMQAALTLKKLGLEPVILEKEMRLGGKLNLWDRLFPTQTPATEVLEPLVRAVSEAGPEDVSDDVSGAVSEAGPEAEQEAGMEAEQDAGSDLIAPVTSDFDDLFWAVARDERVSRGVDRRVEFDFVRNTNVLKISVSGVGYLLGNGGDTDTDTDIRTNPDTRTAPAPVTISSGRAAELPLDIFVLGRNGRYRWDNTIDDHARQVRYPSTNHTYTGPSTRPQTHPETHPSTSPETRHTDPSTRPETRSSTRPATDAGTLSAEVKTMRLDLARHYIDPVTLHIINPLTGADLVPPIDIVREILRIRGDRGEPLYPDQESIDRQYEFPVKIEIGADLSIRITICEWEVETLEPIIEPRGNVIPYNI